MLLDSVQAFLPKCSSENAQRAPSLCPLCKDWVYTHFLTALQQCVLSRTLKAAALLLPWEVLWLRVARRWEVGQQQGGNTLALVLCSSLAVVCWLLPRPCCETRWTLALTWYRHAGLLPGSCSALKEAFSLASEMETLVKNVIASAWLLQLWLWIENHNFIHGRGLGSI